MKSNLIISCSLLLSMVSISSTYTPTQTITTASGPVYGFQHTSSTGFVMDMFFSVPYGNKPQRFQKPVPRTPWQTPLNVSNAPPSCPQSRVPYDEDCLFLKVMRPANSPANANFPVIFWPPGGGFGVGSAVYYNYDVQGTNFVSRNIIIVQPNYREGALGFWSTATSGNQGNWGMWDSLLALNWTRNNIRAFGGNPDRIVLMAQGAGAITNSLMTLTPWAKGMYHSAILFSGTMFHPWVNMPDSVTQQRYATFATLVGCDDASHAKWNNPATRGQIMSCINGKAVFDILKAQAAAAAQLKVDNQFWHPRIDGPGGIWPSDPATLAKSRPNVPIILGATHDEAIWYLYMAAVVFNGQLPINVLKLNTPQTVRDQCTSQVNYAHMPNAAELIKACQWYYVDSQLQGNQPTVMSNRSPYFWLQTAIKILSGLVYQAPAMNDAWHYLQNGNKQVYLYSFDFIRNQSTLWQQFGSFHNMDLIYIEHFLVEIYMKAAGFRWTPDDRKVQQYYSDFVANFAYKDDPSTFGAPWMPVSMNQDGAQEYMSITANPMMKNYFFSIDTYFWNQIVPTLQRLS